MKQILSHVARRLMAVTLWAAASVTGSVALADGSVVISQLYGGGGNSGATLRNDYVELFNRSADAVSLSGWCLQYASAAGAFTLGNNQSTALNGAIPAGGYYLVQLSQGTGGTQNLPTPDASGLTLMSAASGKLALLSSCATPLAESEPVIGGRVVDFVGFGSTASRFEGSGPTANASNTTAARRALNGCQDSDSNQVDFSIGTPSPRNSLSPQQQCAVTNAPVVPSCPATVQLPLGSGGAQLISARDADGLVSVASITAGSRPEISLASFTPAATAGVVAEGTLIFGSALPEGSYFVTVAFSNDDPAPQSASCTVRVDVAPVSTSARIRQIQGAAHVSPRLGQSVTDVPGIVTARSSNGFYMQDWEGDSSDATSEGIFVYTDAAPTVNVGDRVLVTGTVSEFRPGGSDGMDNLSITQIVAPSIRVQSSGNSLPGVVVIGRNGRMPPSQVIDNNTNGNVETSGTFDAVNDAIDFYESLEGMRVRVNEPRATGPTNNFGEIPVLADDGFGSDRTVRGGIRVRPNDFNPERIILDDVLAETPRVNVGATAPYATGVMDYSFGNFKLNVTSAPAFVDSALGPEVTGTTTLYWLTVASFNVENLTRSQGTEKFDALARQIVTNLRAPDVVALMEIQDNNGTTNDSIVDASQTYETLIEAIASVGGPTYQLRQIDPVDDQDGGARGGNIRVGYLFNPQRVTFVDRPGGTSTSATSVVAGPYGPQLSASPGRIDPTNPAFSASRKPLAAEILFNGHKLYLIANHFNSKLGDQPLFGRFQPPQRSTEVQRAQQATIVAQFVAGLHADPNAGVVVLGDINDFEFSQTLQILKNAGLVDLVEALPENERYTYVFDGNSQALDHILISQGLAARAQPDYDIVHVNSEFASRASDHDPEVVKLFLPPQDARLSLYRGGLVLNRATQLFTGTLRLENVEGPAARGPFQLLFQDLPAGVTVANASGYWHGVPYITFPVSSLAVGSSVEATVQFRNPSRVPISYGWNIYSGQF